MSNFQKTPQPRVNAVAFIDYKPAELRLNKQWLIVYYAKNPESRQMERFRVIVPAMASRSERVKYAKKIMLEINKDLEKGILPYHKVSGTSEYKSFKFCSDKFINQLKEEIKKGSKRPDTLRAYNSYFSMVDKYLLEKKLELNLVLSFNKPFIVNYLDWIYFDRSNSARTYNNHLNFIKNFINFCISRDYLKENFTASIEKKDKAPKIRQLLTPAIKEKVKLLQNDCLPYFVLCMTTYYALIRRTELTKLKVHDVNLLESYIFIEPENSKNKKGETVTIPNGLHGLLSRHIADAKPEDFLFGAGTFLPGPTALTPKKISDTWSKYQRIYSIPKIYQFYSLKDTGITDLLNAGVPAIKVRDQARHYDLKTTELYTSRNNSCDEVVKNSTSSF